MPRLLASFSLAPQSRSLAPSPLQLLLSQLAGWGRRRPLLSRLLPSRSRKSLVILGRSRPLSRQATLSHPLARLQPENIQGYQTFTLQDAVRSDYGNSFLLKGKKLI